MTREGMRALGRTALVAAWLASPAGAQTPGAVEVPLSVVGGRLVVPVQAPGGEALRFALTTSSATTVLAESVAARLGAGARLTLGGLAVPAERAATLPDAVLAAGGTPLHGMIAGDLLRDYDVLIDAPGGRLVLKPVGRGVSWSGLALSEPVRLRILHGIVISLDVTLNGRAYPATIDLFTPGVVVNAAVKRDLALADDDRARLALDAVDRGEVAVRVRDDHPLLARWSPNGSAFVIVGTAIAEGCAISLSWVHRELRVCAR